MIFLGAGRRERQVSSPITWYNCDTCARKILTASPEILENTAEDSLHYEVKLKKFSPLTYENQASSVSRHHAAGARRRPGPRIPRDGQIPVADSGPCALQRVCWRAVVLNPRASSKTLAQMAAEDPMMHPPQDEALEGAPKTQRRLAGQNLLPKLIANVKFKDRIEASPPRARTAA